MSRAGLLKRVFDSDVGCQTLWRLSNAKFMSVLRLVESLGHSIRYCRALAFHPGACLSDFEQVPQDDYPHNPRVPRRLLNSWLEKCLLRPAVSRSNSLPAGVPKQKAFPGPMPARQLARAGAAASEDSAVAARSGPLDKPRLLRHSWINMTTRLWEWGCASTTSCSVSCQSVTLVSSAGRISRARTNRGPTNDARLSGALRFR